MLWGSPSTLSGSGRLYSLSTAKSVVKAWKQTPVAREKRAVSPLMSVQFATSHSLRLPRISRLVLSGSVLESKRRTQPLRGSTTPLRLSIVAWQEGEQVSINENHWGPSLDTHEETQTEDHDAPSQLEDDQIPSVTVQ